jgi:hypothetical protein
MFGSEVLEVVIGTIFLFLVVSVICSAIREGIESWLKTRAAYLEHGIRELLHDSQATGLAASFYNHPLIYGLFSGGYKPGKAASETRLFIFAKGGNLPSYLPAKDFALALMDLAARGPVTDAVSSHPSAPVISLHNIRMNVGNLKNEPVQRVLLGAIDAAQGDLNALQKNIEDWYNSSMDRVSGWYKRSTHWIIFGIALFVAVAVNINAITVVDYLYRNGAVRATLVARAQNAAADPALLNEGYDQINQELSSMSLPIGWRSGWGSPRRGNEPGAEGIWNNGIAPPLGWLLTALAATMGAPFWFDVLNKVMVIRSTVKPREKSQEEGSEDRQVSPAAATQLIHVPAPPPAAVPPTAGGPPSRQMDKVPSPLDDRSGVDACDVVMGAPTPDDELPASEGGVA